MTQRPIVEVVLFKLKPGVDEAAFLDASEAVMPDLRALSGFIRRELLRDAAGQWIDLVYWNSLAEAHRAAESFTQLPSAQPLMGMLDMANVTMLHLEQVQIYSDSLPS